MWCLATEDGDATAVRALDEDRLIVGTSTWRSAGDLAGFVHGGLHVAVMRRGREWSALVGQPCAAAWWVPAGTTPTVADAHAHAETAMALLRERGPTPGAYTVQRPFLPPGSDEAARLEGT